MHTLGETSTFWTFSNPARCGGIVAAHFRCVGPQTLRALAGKELNLAPDFLVRRPAFFKSAEPLLLASAPDIFPTTQSRFDISIGRSAPNSPEASEGSLRLRGAGPP